MDGWMTSLKFYLKIQFTLWRHFFNYLKFSEQNKVQIGELKNNERMDCEYRTGLIVLNIPLINFHKLFKMYYLKSSSKQITKSKKFGLKLMKYSIEIQ